MASAPIINISKNIFIKTVLNNIKKINENKEKIKTLKASKPPNINDINELELEIQQLSTDITRGKTIQEYIILVEKNLKKQDEEYDKEINKTKGTITDINALKEYTHYVPSFKQLRRGFSLKEGTKKVNAYDLNNIHNSVINFCKIEKSSGKLEFNTKNADDFDKANPIYINEDVFSFLSTLNKEKKDNELKKFITKVKPFTEKQKELRETFHEYNTLPDKNKNLKGILANYPEIKKNFEDEGGTDNLIEKLVKTIKQIKIKENIQQISFAITLLKTAFDSGVKNKPDTIKYKQDIDKEQQKLDTLVSNYEAAVLAYNTKVDTAKDIYEKQYPDIIQDIKNSAEYEAITQLIQTINDDIQKILKPITKTEYTNLLADVNCTEQSIDDAIKVITDNIKNLFINYKTDIGKENTIAKIQGIYDNYIAAIKDIDTTDLTHLTAQVQNCLDNAQTIDQDYLTGPEKTNLQTLIQKFTKTITTNNTNLKDIINNTPVNNNSKKIKETKEKYLTITDDINTKYPKANVNQKVIDINAELLKKNTKYDTDLTASKKQSDKQITHTNFIESMKLYKSNNIDVFEKEIQYCLDTVNQITPDDIEFLQPTEVTTITDLQIYYDSIIKVKIKKINDLVVQYLATAQQLLNLFSPPSTAPKPKPLPTPTDTAKDNYDKIIGKINNKCSQAFVNTEIKDINAEIAQINTDYTTNATTANTKTNTNTIKKKSELLREYSGDMNNCKHKLNILKNLIEKYNKKLNTISDAEKNLLQILDPNIITTITDFNNYYTDKMKTIKDINDAIDQNLKDAQDNYDLYFGTFPPPLPPGSPSLVAAAAATPPGSPSLVVAPALHRTASRIRADTIAAAIVSRSATGVSSFKGKAPAQPPKDPNEGKNKDYEDLKSDDPTNTCSIENIDNEIKKIDNEITKLFDDYKTEIGLEQDSGKINNIYKKYYNTNQHPYIKNIVDLTTRIIECLKKANEFKANPLNLTVLDKTFLDNLIKKFLEKKQYLETGINVINGKNQKDSVKIKDVKIMFLNLINEITPDYTTAAINTYLDAMNGHLQTIQTTYNNKQKDETNTDTIEQNYKEYKRKIQDVLTDNLMKYEKNLNPFLEKIKKVFLNKDFLQPDDLNTITELNKNYPQMIQKIGSLIQNIMTDNAKIVKEKTQLVENIKKNEAAAAKGTRKANAIVRKRSSVTLRNSHSSSRVAPPVPPPRSSIRSSTAAGKLSPITHNLSHVVANASRSPSPSSTSSSTSASTSVYEVPVLQEVEHIYGTVNSVPPSPSSSPTGSPVLLRSHSTRSISTQDQPVTQIHRLTFTEEDVDLYNKLSDNVLTQHEIDLFTKIYTYKNYKLGPDSIPMYYKDHIHNLDTTYDQIMSEISILRMLVGLLDYTYNDNFLFKPLNLFDESTPNKNVRIIIEYAKQVCKDKNSADRKTMKRTRSASSVGGAIKNFNKKSKHKNMNKSKPKVKSIHKQTNKKNKKNNNHKKSKHKN